MIDSVVFIKQDIEDVINYYLSISDSERIVENEIYFLKKKMIGLILSILRVMLFLKNFY